MRAPLHLIPAAISDSDWVGYGLVGCLVVWFMAALVWEAVRHG